MRGTNPANKRICRKLALILNRGLQTSWLAFRRKVKIIRRRLMSDIEMLWCMFWAITFGKVWIEMGETLKLWEDIEEAQ